MPWLPPVDPETNEFECILVFVPAKQEYIQAFFGALEELSQVWNWEADRDTQALIRQQWLAAEMCTRDCTDVLP